MSTYLSDARNVMNRAIYSNISLQAIWKRVEIPLWTNIMMVLPRLGTKGKGGRSHKKTSEDKQTRHNSFKILEEVENNMETDPVKDNIPKEQDLEAEMEDIPVKDRQIEELQRCMQISKEKEMTPTKVGMEDHELHEILDKENLDLEQFLEHGKNNGVDSLLKEDYDRVQ